MSKSKFIRLKVNTLWVGRVGIRDRYIQQANLEQKGLEITYKTQRMVIPFEDVNKLIVAKSDHDFYDKFSNQRHFLFYYNWKPIVVDDRKMSLEELAKNGTFG